MNDRLSSNKLPYHMKFSRLFNFANAKLNREIKVTRTISVANIT